MQKGQGKVKTPKQKLNLALVGAGGFADVCLNAFSNIGEIEVIAICDKRQEALNYIQEKYKIKTVYKDYSALLKNSDIDIIHICTPPYLHAKQCIAAINAGKHVFCEKPLAVTTKEAKEIVALLKKKPKIKLVVDFVMRYNPYYEALDKLIKSEILGHPQRFFLENHAQDQFLPTTHWFWNRKMSGAIMIEHGVHFFDILRKIFGEAKYVSSWQLYRKKTRQLDRMSATFVYGNDLVGSFYHAFNKAARAEKTWIEISLSKGYLLLEGWIPEVIKGEVWLTDNEKRKLAELLPGIKFIDVPNLPFFPPMKDTGDTVTAGGSTFPLGKKVEFIYQPITGKGDIYYKSIENNMREFAESILKRRKHRISVKDCFESVVLSEQASH